MTTTIARVELTSSQRRVIEGLANGNTLATVALDPQDPGKHRARLPQAGQGEVVVRQTPAAVAVGYAIEAIAVPNCWELKGCSGLVSNATLCHSFS